MIAHRQDERMLGAVTLDQHRQCALTFLMCRFSVVLSQAGGGATIGAATTTTVIILDYPDAVFRANFDPMGSCP
jgi:hypothetical protein